MLLCYKLGRLAQSGRALPLQGRSHRFKSCSAHKVTVMNTNIKIVCLLLLNLYR